jgi:hypothetical protein
MNAAPKNKNEFRLHGSAAGTNTDRNATVTSEISSKFIVLESTGGK